MLSASTSLGITHTPQTRLVASPSGRPAAALNEALARPMTGWFSAGNEGMTPINHPLRFPSREIPTPQSLLSDSKTSSHLSVQTRGPKRTACFWYSQKSKPTKNECSSESDATPGGVWPSLAKELIHRDGAPGQVPPHTRCFSRWFPLFFCFLFQAKMGRIP